MFLAIAGGAPIIALAGWCMDRVRVRWWVWLPLWLALAATICITSILDYPSYQRAISKNGSLQAYVLFGSNFSLMLTSLFLLVGFGFFAIPRAIRRWKLRQEPGPRCAACDYNLTGNLSGRCPECGAACSVPADRAAAPDTAAD
jgi:hypothetical protein